MIVPGNGLFWGSQKGQTGQRAVRICPMRFYTWAAGDAALICLTYFRQGVSIRGAQKDLEIPLTARHVLGKAIGEVL